MFLKDVVCLITGGASGLGLATARNLLKNGAKVVVADLQELDGQIAGPDCTFVKADVTSEADINLAVSKAIETYGFLNASVNCAAINMSGQYTVSEGGEPHSLDSFEKVLKINTVGTFNVTRLAAKAMTGNIPNKEGERGVIVNVSSTHGFEGVAGKVAYSASKGAIHSMTLPLARDLAKFGVRVMCISPGMFETPMFVIGRPDPIERAEITKIVPFPSRGGKPDEFAHLVKAVIENPMLNGEIIRIDGAVRLNR